MLKVEKTTYRSLPKSNKLAKLTTKIKEPVQKIEEEKNKKTKQSMIMKH